MDLNQQQPQMPPQIPMQDPAQMMPQGAPQDQPITEEQKQQLMVMIMKVKEKLAAFEAMKTAAGGKKEEYRQTILREIFTKFEQAGIDLTNREEVADFIAQLQAQNPEIAMIFEEAMSKLLGENTTPEMPSQGGSPQGPQSPAELASLGMAIPNNNMNINQNETLPEDIRGSI